MAGKELRLRISEPVEVLQDGSRITAKELGPNLVAFGTNKGCCYEIVPRSD
ncbi:hypothetical protein [Paenibacillus hexagrammi]|uniref:hypothetical protein n=1 Tax=Paenibacillus hexagrammi TaxID=2908839 RepID=UPI00331303A9